MKSLELIPQVFYDLISRIIPGFIGIFLIGISTEIQLHKFPALIFKGSETFQNYGLFLFLFWIVAAYLLGQVIALFSSLYEQIVVKNMFPKYFNILYQSLFVKDIFAKREKDILMNEVKDEKKDERIIQLKIWAWYDWLRVNHSEAGARCAKVRAEYRMHAGISVVMTFTVLLHLISHVIYHTKFNWTFVITAIIVSILFSWANARNHRMFELNVINQYIAAKN